MKKILLIILIVVAVILLFIGIIGYFYLGTIVKLGIEKFGPEITKVSVNVSSVNVSLLSGTASIKGLVVGNPQGFTQPQAINFGNISINLDPSSILSNKIVIHSVRVDSPVITYESALGGSNLSKILSNVNATDKNSNTTGNTPSPSAASKPASTIEIDDFLITGAKVNLGISGIISKTLPLGDIHLTNLGKGNNGLTPVKLTQAILKAILEGALKAVTSSVSTIGQTISSVTGSLGSLLGK